MTKNISIVGAFWGDEGKGKFVDFLSQYADCIVRFQGGDNAGHTIYLGSKSIKLRIIPSGCLNANKICCLASGMVINPVILIKELAMLKENKINVNLKIASNCHVILPYHPNVDQWQEMMMGEDSIGTTLRGIGPCYEDRMARIGITVYDLLNKQELTKKIARNLKFKQHILNNKFNATIIANSYHKYGLLLKPYIVSIVNYLNEIIDSKKILFESAQGTMLDNLHGTYPFVTSSHPIVSSVSINCGINSALVDKKLGIVKAYISRVGNGLLPTQINNKIAEYIQIKGNEYGTVTKRKRRVGWMDLVILRYSQLINGFDYFAISLLDVLSNINEIKVAVSYTVNKTIKKIFNPQWKNDDITKINYKIFPGWHTNISRAQKWEDLPKNCQDYVSFIAKECKTKLAYISVGPKRENTIFVNDIWKD